MKNVVTNVKVRDRWVCDTNGDMYITALVNKVPLGFYFRSCAGGSSNWQYLGVDCDEATKGSSRVTISRTGTGTHKSYALRISSGVLTAHPKENQKDFSFTGRYYSTKAVPRAFKQTLQKMIENNEVSDSFKEAVGLA